MKKTKQIKLVLVTAVLASCNRMVVPQMQPEGKAADSVLTAKPDYGDTTYVDSFCACNCQKYYPAASYTFSPYGSTYYIGPVNSVYYNGNSYRYNAVWRGGKYVVRGGFGKSGGATSGS